MIAPARLAAYAIGLAVARRERDLPAAIAHARESLKDERDRALATEIATGVQRHRGALDHLISSLSKRPLARLDAEVVEILRLSIYQLRHLTRVPAAAVVDDAVKLTGRAGKRSAAGLVNAVLRTASRQRHALPLPPRPESPDHSAAVLEYFSITLSHPAWLASRWLNRLGFAAAERWMLFNNVAAPLTLRANRLLHSRDEVTLHLEVEDVVTRAGMFAPDALIVEGGHPLRNPDRLAGWFVVQDEASQLVALLAGTSPGPRVLDACASPGGKTTALAASVQDGVVVASDVRDRRMKLLQSTVTATGARNVALVQADLERALPFPERFFDTVLVDAPCSGLGTLRRDPDIRWRRVEPDLLPLAAAQRHMLANAATVVRPGGRLIYATCSSEPEENDEVVLAFLASHADFALMHAAAAHPQLPASVVDDQGFLRTAPHLHQLEGFFGAVLVRRL